MPVYKDEIHKNFYVQFYYVDWQGQRRKKFKRGFKTSREAKAYEHNFLNKAAADNTMTFSNLCAYYLEDSKVRLKPTTQRNKEYLIKKWILPYFKDIEISRITPIMIRKWQNSIMNQDSYTPTYERVINAKLSAIFNYAVKYYGLRNNPVRISGPMGKKNAERLNFWTLDEFKNFVAKIDRKDQRPFYEAFMVLFYTGIRVGELLALTVSDLDFKAKTISITKNYARVDGKDLILSPKTPKSKRIVNIPDFLCSMLQDYIQKLYAPDLRLFFTLNKYSLNKRLKKTAAAAGVKAIRVHDLRHSHASLLIELGFSPLLISQRLGHEKVETTLQTYSHLYPNKADEVASRLNSLQSGKKPNQ